MRTFGHDYRMSNEIKNSCSDSYIKDNSFIIDQMSGRKVRFLNITLPHGKVIEYEPKLSKKIYLSLSLQELKDEESEIKLQIQQARNISDRESVITWTKDLVECQNLIRNYNKK